ncbi:hypothetical protein P4S72_25310 [Vibrio sp. PP-XX7]
MDGLTSVEWFGAPMLIVVSAAFSARASRYFSSLKSIQKRFFCGFYARYPERIYSPSMAHKILKNSSGIFIRRAVDFSGFGG